MTNLSTLIRPNHYGGKDNAYEAIKVIEAWDLNFNLGNVVKYVSRAGKKDNIMQDLTKAATYLQFEIDRLNKQNEEFNRKVKTPEHCHTSTYNKVTDSPTVDVKEIVKIPEIIISNLSEIYDKVTDIFDKILLNNLLNKNFTEDLTKCIFDFQGVCEKAKVSQGDYLITEKMNRKEKLSIYEKKVELIFKVFNGDWEKDIYNESQQKYHLYLPSVNGIDILGWAVVPYEYNSVGSRFCGKNEKIVRHIYKYFSKEYNDYYIT